MAGLPSKCTQCGHVFASSGIVIVGATQVTTKNNTVSCPKCGGRAKGVEGQFSLKNDSFTPISASRSDLEILRQLYSKAKQAGESQEDREELVREVEAISPALAKAISPYALSYPTTIFVAFLFLLLSRCDFSFNTNVTLDLNEAIDQVIQMIESEDSEELKAEASKEIEEKLKTPQEPEKKTKRQSRRERGKSSGKKSKSSPKK